MLHARHAFVAALLTAFATVSPSRADTPQAEPSLLGSVGKTSISSPDHQGLLRADPHGASGAGDLVGLSLPFAGQPALGQDLAAGARLGPTDSSHSSLLGGKRGRRALWLLGAAGALIATDRSSMHALGSAFVGDNDPGDETWLSGVETFGGTGGVASVVGLYALGDRYDKQTAKIAARALGRTVLETQALKTVTGRDRPRDSDGRGPFHGPAAGSTAHSFPSGHTSAAFALASVYGERYPKWKWPLYGLAAGVGWARMRHNAHFPSDVFVGAAIGIHNGHTACKHASRKRRRAPVPSSAPDVPLAP